ncbi:MAG: glycosyltransferase family 2 protein [Acidiferrobacteraceae bacterium]
MNVPKASVCVPVYNAAAYIRQALESVLAQTFRDYEIVIVDNCSTDATASIIEDATKRTARNVRFYRNDRNIGLVANLNKCLEYARGDYIKFLCADDLLLPGCLEAMAKALDHNHSATLVGCTRTTIDKHGRILGSKHYPGHGTVISGPEVITRCLFGGNFIGEPSAVMFRRRQATGGFQEGMPQLSDMDMWFRLLEQGDFIVLKQSFCAVRLHTTQVTHANTMSDVLVRDNIKLFDTYSRKTYIRLTFRGAIQHKILMAYRTWISREYISDESRRMVLNKYSNMWIYRLMPFALLMLSIWPPRLPWRKRASMRL